VAGHPNCVAVQAALRAAGVAGDIRLLPESAPTATRAAEQLGVDVAAIANSLIFLTERNEPVLIMASGGHRVDLRLAAAALRVATLRRADADSVRTATGQTIGGVSPVGHPTRLPALVDEALAAYETVWAAGGVPAAVFPTTFAELVMLTGGTPAQIA
jgi:prolyl-tRNA editing enzyme YbaK/EbsC (Cys-tRNA(Pro) deacylase)